jgi:TonB family protein
MAIRSRIGARCAGMLLVLILGQPGVSGDPAMAGGRPSEGAGTVSSTGSTPVPAESLIFHLRFLRVRLDGEQAGSALFSTNETIVPLSEREFWGRADQTEALRQALHATDVEPLPGVVVGSGASAQGGAHRFKTALGERLVEVSFRGEDVGGGWSRVSLRAEGERGEELMDSQLRIPETGTVALVTPLPESTDALIIGVTPLVSSKPFNLEQIPYVDGVTITNPKLVSTEVPKYPESAKEQRISGQVILQAVIRTDGTPDRLVVLQMPAGGEWLAGAAVESISKWRWEPARRDGIPVDVYFTIIVEFELQ